jgi:predicted ABC-type ATPase
LIVETDSRPVLIAIAGPNGAGKSTFYEAHLSHLEFPFVNADVIAKETSLGAYEAIAEDIRRSRFANRESFIFETVFSDPVGEKLSFLEAAATSGYNVVLVFVGVSDAEVSVDRVALRVLRGGHDVPKTKLMGRYPRTIENLRLALQRLPLVRVYDNDDLRDPYRPCLQTSRGEVIERVDPLPEWLVPLLPEPVH